MSKWLILSEVEPATGSSLQLLAVLADDIEANNADDAVQAAIAAGSVRITSTQGGRFRIVRLEGSSTYSLNLKIEPHDDSSGNGAIPPAP